MAVVKLAFTSDLHVPITPMHAIASLAREVAEFGPDAFVLAGDIAESLLDMDACLREIRRQVSAPLLVLPGNHDLWARDCPSRYKWEHRLAEATRAAGAIWLEGDAWSHHGIAVAGTIAWYDYSAKDAHVTATLEQFARDKKYFNMDAVAIDWGWTDLDFARLVARPFLATLERLEADPSVRQIIVATHVPLVECQMCRNSGNPDWAFSNAYFGNMTLGDEVVKYAKVANIISGHTHVERRGQVMRDKLPPIDACVIPSNYGRPAWVQLTLTWEE